MPLTMEPDEYEKSLRLSVYKGYMFFYVGWKKASCTAPCMKGCKKVSLSPFGMVLQKGQNRTNCCRPEKQLSSLFSKKISTLNDQ